ncbi:MAG TPA: hypothetical protein VGM06_05810 [Polyangiaceae bacterium]
MARGHVRPSSALGASLAAAALLSSARADAYRPFDGTDADTAEPQVFELELGPVHYFREGDQNVLIAPALVLNLGLFDHTELVIDAEDFVAVGKLEPGVERVSLEGDDFLVKHVFREGILQGSTGPSVAAEGGVLLPLIPGDAGFGASLDVITSYRWSWGAVHWNELFAYSRIHHADLFTDLIVEGPYDWTVRPVAEGFYDKDFAGDASTSVLVGAIWRVRDSLAFDVGLRGARTGNENEAEVRLGLTWSVALGASRDGVASGLIDGRRPE